MKRKTLHVIWFGTFALLMVLSRAHRAEAEDQQAPYWRMAPLGQYLMADRNAEIVLARTRNEFAPRLGLRRVAMVF